MLITRLYRTQVELQSHRIWLARFVNSTRTNPTQATAPQLHPYSTRQVNTKAHRSSRARAQIRTRKPSLAREARTAEDAAEFSHRQELQAAVNDYDLERVIELYNSFPNKRSLNRKELSSLGQCIHYCVRLHNQTPQGQRREEDGETIIGFAEQLIKDITQGKLIPAPTTYKHIIGALKEAGARESALEFWQWLEIRPEEYLSHDVYAAAIELLAVEGTALPEIEELYQTCLARLPGPFLEYHLSANAIVPDRERELAIGSVPVLLLQAIATARLLRGDTRSAYLALDTALRLRPTAITPRFFSLFMDGRPLSEAFTVFAMACRSGQAVGSSLFKRLLFAIRRSSPLDSLSPHIIAIRVMIAAMYLHIGAGASVKSNSVSELVIAITQILRLPDIDLSIREDRQQIVDEVRKLIKRTLETFARFGATVHLKAFNSIIVNIGGHGRSRDAVQAALADLRVLGLEPDVITHRSVLTANGLLGDKALVEEAWMDLVSAKGNNALLPDEVDLVVLIKAARSSEHLEFARQQLDALREELKPDPSDRLTQLLGSPAVESSPAESRTTVSLTSVLAELRKLDADLQAVDVQIGQEKSVQDFREWPPPTRLLPCPDALSTPEEAMKALYDEFSTEPHGASRVDRTDNEDKNGSEPPPPGTRASAVASNDEDQPQVQDVQPDVSSTNLTYGTLRYESWKDVNYLLGLAEQHDQEYARLADKAIAAGTRPPTRPPTRQMGLTRLQQAKMLHFGLSQSADHDRAVADPARSSVGQVQKAKTEVLRLRGIGHLG